MVYHDAATERAAGLLTDCEPAPGSRLDPPSHCATPSPALNASARVAAPLRALALPCTHK